MPIAFCQTAAIRNSGLEVAAWAGDKTGGSKPLSRLLCQKTRTSSSKDQTEGVALLPQTSWSGGPKVTIFKLRWGTGRTENTGLDQTFGCGYSVEFYWQRNYNPWSAPNCPRSKQGYRSSTVPPWIWPSGLFTVSLWKRAFCKIDLISRKYRFGCHVFSPFPPY